MKLHKALGMLALAALAGCGAPNNPHGLIDAIALCQNGAQHTEIMLDGTVQRVLGVRRGRSGRHEGFYLEPIVPQSGRMPAVKVENNIDITGPVPLQRGDRVQLKGQYECNDGVVHWTHHDPSGRHDSGYLRVNGQIYQ